MIWRKKSAIEDLSISLEENFTKVQYGKNSLTKECFSFSCVCIFWILSAKKKPWKIESTALKYNCMTIIVRIGKSCLKFTGLIFASATWTKNLFGLGFLGMSLMCIFSLSIRVYITIISWTCGACEISSLINSGCQSDIQTRLEIASSMCAYSPHYTAIKLLSRLCRVCLYTISCVFFV